MKNVSRSGETRRIALTGGPGGGKATLMEELRARDPYRERWILGPEAAPLLFRAGLDGRHKTFQRAVVTVQITLETVCAEAACPGQVLLCHRGTLDPLAYWLRNGWERDEFFDLTEMTPEAPPPLRHHDPPAKRRLGAAAQYRRWPDAHRPESPEQAAEIAYLCTTSDLHTPAMH